MLADAALPPGLQASGTGIEERRGCAYASARWSPAELQRLMDHLATAGRVNLLSVSNDELLAAWSTTVASFLDPASTDRRQLDPCLARLCALSPQGLGALERLPSQQATIARWPQYSTVMVFGPAEFL